MRGNRELQLALALVLAGSALLLVAAGQPWVHVVVRRPAPLPSRSTALTGAEVVRSLRPLALVGLAGVAALAATRGRGRLLLGALLTVVGGTLVVHVGGLLAGAPGSLLEGSDPAGSGRATTGAWPALALAGGLLLALGGLLVAVRGRRWSAMSERYEVPAARAQAVPARPEVAAWEALDRGEDPTQEPRPGRP